MPPLFKTCPALALTAAVALVSAATPASAKTSKRLPRSWASKHHVGVRSGARDFDRDGLSNWGEYRAQTDPHLRDSDRDRIPDGLEDGDRDHLDNVDEVTAATDPRRRDSDRDGISDGREDRDRDGLPNAAETPTGHLLSRPDTDGDGILDGRENAGTITAVAGVTLTLRLAAGGSVTARLSGDSWIECDSSVPASGSGSSGSDASSGSVTQDPAPESGDGASTDPVSEFSDDLPGVEDDTANLAQVVDTPDDDDDDETTDPSDNAPDLGSCASLVHVGAIVHEATIASDDAGRVFSDFQLMSS